MKAKLIGIWILLGAGVGIAFRATLGATDGDWAIALAVLAVALVVAQVLNRRLTAAVVEDDG